MKNLIIICIACMLLLSIHLKSFGNKKLFLQYISRIDSITAQAETEKYLWIGTQNHGLFMIKKKNEKVFHMTHENSALPSDKITCIAATQNGDIYIGTDHGILRYDHFAFLVINTENSKLASDNITSLLSTAGDIIIAGTADGGLTVFSPGGAKNFNKQNNSLASNHILALEKNEHNECIVVVENNIRYLMHKQGVILITKN